MVREDKIIMEIELKKGYLTTEFWVIAIFLVADAILAIKGYVKPGTAAILGVVASTLYALARSAIKLGMAKK